MADRRPARPTIRGLRARRTRVAGLLLVIAAAATVSQIYGNEPWHYELRPEAVDDGCPPVYADPTHDPRMQR